MKPTRRNHLASTTILLVMTALGPSTVSATPEALYSGLELFSDQSSGLYPQTYSPSSKGLELFSSAGPTVISSYQAGVTPGATDGGVILFGKPLTFITGVTDGMGGTFDVWDDADFLSAPGNGPVFRIDTVYNTAKFKGLNVTIEGGSLNVSGNLNLTGGTGTGLNFGGASIFTLDASGKVNYGSTRNVAIASTTAANAAATTGALTVAGGIGVAKDSYVNGLTVGKGAGSANGNNTAFGLDSLKSNTTGGNNTAYGANALKLNTIGGNNTAVGVNSQAGVQTGSLNTSVGNGALYANTSGAANTAMGASSLPANTTGGWNSGFGSGALLSNQTGDYNTAAGVDAVRSNISGGSNAGFGFGALYSTTHGANNSALGAAAGAGNTTGTHNVFMGINAGTFQANGTTNLLTPYYSIYIGSYARGKDNSDNNSIVIGASAIGEGANTVVMGNANTQTSHFFGQTTLTNTPWKNRPGGTSALADPLAGDTDRDGNALVVEGHTILKGKVTISERQGDIPMFTGF